MKNLLLIFTLVITSIVSAQDSTAVKAEAPKIVSKLMYGNTLKVEDLEFKFVAVESDSRCPKGVQCVWAGEAIVLVDVFKNGNKLEQKRLVFSPTSQLQNALGNLFSSESLKVSGLNIVPYPESGSKIKIEDYYIQLAVKN
ncbi:hypothetical protein [Lacinutrix sp. MedPE-SW]|uniref:hypothetical protein n=1 Tax=Lacinutrix sp. MedPE-SW TaxID=1860087 RepID=UPI00091D7241|nr:hypothetical protein [Lacinutrix sp. MedPE-SW]OIQ23609.1 MAG: hypothetical protein BM549_03320 [Lacinutrix sp. MedPE-SW]